MNVPKTGPIDDLRFDFDSAILFDLRERARVRNREMAEHPTSYGETSFDGQVVGLLGEFGVERWFRDHDFEVECIADNVTGDRSRGDLLISPASTVHAGIQVSTPVAIEVKTSQMQHAQKFGGQLNKQQLSNMRCDAIVWCLTGSTLPRDWVRIAGWLPRVGLEYVDVDPSSTGKSQVRITAGLRDPAELVDWVRERLSITDF